MNRNVDNSSVYGDIQPKYQFIAEKYPGEVTYDISDIVICYLDIETGKNADGDSSAPELADGPVLTIALSFTNFTKKVILGLKEYSPRDDEFYVQCETEEALLNKFLNIWKSNWPDIVSGWFIEGFDIPFLINRIERVLGEKESNRLSPYGVILPRQVHNDFGQDEKRYTIYGLSILDYLALYKKFSMSNQESFKLGYIAEVELNETKVDYSHIGTLHDLYDKDFQLFIEYNMRDVDLVVRMEQKMRFLELAMIMAYDSKVNFEDVFSQVRMWDSLIYNKLLEKRQVIPPRKSGEVVEFEGAFVKTPQSGAKNWLITIDATSLYPMLIQHYNLSPDTILNETVPGVSPEVLINKSFDTSFLSGTNKTMTANGQLFDKTKLGLLPGLMSWMFQQRKNYKSLMLQQQEEYETKLPSLTETEKTDYLNRITRLSKIEQAKKISLNSCYGIMGQRYFRFSDARIAEAITLSGQLTIRWTERKINEFMNWKAGTTNVDYIIGSDTDSLFIDMNTMVQQNCSNMSQKDILKFINKFYDELSNDVIRPGFDELVDYMNAPANFMHMKLEAVVDKAIFLTKKRYILNIIENEGVHLAEPKIKIKGFEAIKSSTPTISRKKLKEAIKIALRGTEAEMQKFIMKLRQEYPSLPVEDVAFPKSANNIREFEIGRGQWKKGTPIHVKGSILFNRLIEEKKLTNKYPHISSGDKIKYTYLRKPNPVHEPVIAFPGELPTEFGLGPYIDYKTQFEKGFLSPLQSILENIGWSEHEQISIEDLLS